MNQSYQPVCSKCNGVTEYKAGTNKSGKPYSGNFCTNPQCKNVDWVATQPPVTGPPAGQPPVQNQPPPQQPPKQEQDWDAINKKKQEAILWGQACNKAVDLVSTGVLPCPGANAPVEQVSLHIYQVATALYAQFVRMPRVTTDAMAGRTQGDPGAQEPPDWK